MNREEAAQELGISIRSLQRAVKRGALKVKYKRGASGKHEAVFDAEEVARFKEEMEREVIPEPAPPATTNDTEALARIDAPEEARNALIQLLERANKLDEQKTTPAVAIENKPLLKLDEASALTGLSRQILKNAIDNKKLKAQIVGKAWRVKREELDQFIKRM
jgi:excisionase family DNA binding protein